MHHLGISIQIVAGEFLRIGGQTGRLSDRYRGCGGIHELFSETQRLTRSIRGVSATCIKGPIKRP